MIKQLPLETLENRAQTIQTSLQLGQMENFNRNNDTKSRKRSQNFKGMRTIIINFLPWKTVREHCKRTVEKQQ